MKMNFSRSTLGVIAAALISTQAWAVNSINVQTFNPSTSDHFVLLEDGFNSDFPRTANYYFGANYNYATDPLTVVDGGRNLGNIIDSIQTFDVMFGFKASKKFGLFVGLPIHFVSYPSTPFAGLPSGSGSGIGDLKLMAKIRLTEDNSNTSIALIPEFHLPTGNTENFVSDASTAVGIRGVLERQYEDWTFVANLGFMAAANSRYDFVSPQGNASIDFRKRLNLGLGGFVPFTEKWGANFEYNSTFPIPFNDSLNPNELYAGLRYQQDPSWVWTFGGSIGKIGGPTGLGFRAIAGVRFTIFEDAKAAPAPRPVYTPAPTPVPTSVPVATPEPKQIVIYHSTHVEVLREVSFEHASANLTPDGKAILNQVARVLEENKKHFTKIMVDGHTNRLGSDAYNMKLSLARAKSVKTYLVSQGVPANALEARGFGYRKPMLPYSDPKAMEVNRRVEFLVVR